MGPGPGGPGPGGPGPGGPMGPGPGQQMMNMMPGKWLISNFISKKPKFLPIFQIFFEQKTSTRSIFAEFESALIKKFFFGINFELSPF